MIFLNCWTKDIPYSVLSKNLQFVLLVGFSCTWSINQLQNWRSRAKRTVYVPRKTDKISSLLYNWGRWGNKLGHFVKVMISVLKKHRNWKARFPKSFVLKAEADKRWAGPWALTGQIVRKQICEGDGIKSVRVFKGLQSCLVVFKI